MKIELEITSCKDCPKFLRERMWTEDSWEEAYNWFCNAGDKKKIEGYVEWHEEKSIKVPEWCPLSVKQEILINYESLNRPNTKRMV